MDKRYDRLTVYFEDPFWVGVFERIEEERLSVCKVTFGQEPKEYEIYEFILDHFYQLKFSPGVDVVMKETSGNPKRQQREAHRQTQDRGIGTRSQQALQLQREENKRERKCISREERESEKQRQFDLHQQKRKEKHRGH